MNKLLSANFSRMWKDKTFWLSMGAMLVYSVVYMQNGVQAKANLPEYHHSLDQYCFHFALPMGMFCAVFASMFLGTEYGHGTIRNKIAAGHRRAEVYLSSLLLTFSATLLMILAWLPGVLAAVPALGGWEHGIQGLLLYLALAVMAAGCFASIFTFIGMLSANKAATAVLSILVFLGLLLFSSMVYNTLQQPEMTTGISMTAGEIELGEPIPNPYYITGAQRKIYEFLLDFLPTGQSMQLWFLAIANPLRCLLSSAFITVVTSLGGLYLFQKKDLK